MIKDIIKYPQTPSGEFNAPVRLFNDEIKELIQDLKDTIVENNLESLSAFQINNSFNIIVILQKDGTFLELINARIYQNKGEITSLESTEYFPNCTAEVTRSKHIKVLYETFAKEQKYFDASDNYAILIQQKIDYTFGANFRVRLSKEEKEKLDIKLEYGIDVMLDNTCPTTFKRDKILKGINLLLLLSLLAVFSSFFLLESQLVLLNNLLNISFISIFTLIIIYFFYAQYEGRKYTNCMSCQVGNIIGTALVHTTKLISVYLIKLIVL